MCIIHKGFRGFRAVSSALIFVGNLIGLKPAIPYEIIHSPDSIKENRIVITKDSDFLDSYYIKDVPAKLLLITTGNIRNKELLKLFDANFDKIYELFRDHTFVELSNSEIIAHE